MGLMKRFQAGPAGMLPEVIIIEDERVEQGILNISCNKMVYSDTDAQAPPPDAFDNTVIDVGDSTDAARNLTLKSGDQQPTDEVLLGVIIGCGMFFAFMLLGASVFIYCYCRAQRSAGNLGVRPRLSKIGDQWAVSTTGDAGAATNRQQNSRKSNSDRKQAGVAASNANQSGGYILKKNPSSGKGDHKDGSKFGSSAKAQAAKMLSKGGNKLPVKGVARNTSFDGESSFVDFEHDSIKTHSHEQSVESRHVVGECLLKIPEDRLRLLGNNSLVCEQTVQSPAPNDRKTNLVAATAIASAAAADHLLETCSTSILSGNNDEDENVALPIVVKCEVVAGHSETITTHVGDDGEVQEERQLLINAAITRMDVITSDIEPEEDSSAMLATGCDDSIKVGVIASSPSSASVSKSSRRSNSVRSTKSTSASSTGSSSPLASSVIYETLLINPPLSLASNKGHHNQTPSYNSAYNYPPTTSGIIYSNVGVRRQQPQQQQTQSVQGAPHQRFANFGQPDRPTTAMKRIGAGPQSSSLKAPTVDKSAAAPLSQHSSGGESSSIANSESQQMNPSPSKDSLSSVSGIIKLDIISAF